MFSVWRLLFVLFGINQVVRGKTCKLNPEIDARITKHADKQLALCKGYLDVTLPPYNAAGNGVTDDSAAVIKAIEDAFANDLVAFFPADKKFLISKQIRMIQTSSNWADAWDGYQLVGSTKGKPPVLILKDGSKVTDNIFLYFRTLVNGKVDKPPEHYSDMIRGIHIDMGNNPEVTALSMSGAQRCSIEDIYISGQAFYAGIKGLPGSGGFSGNIEVDGGQIGVWQAQFRPNPSVTNLVLRNQAKTGVWHQITRGPLVLSGFEIHSPPAPAPDYRAIRVHGEHKRFNMKEGDGSLALEDGLIVVKGDSGVAIETIEANLAFRNVFFQATKTVQETSRNKWENPKPADLKNVLVCHGTGTKAWNHIAKWVRTELNSHIKVAGTPVEGSPASYPPTQIAHPCGNSEGPDAGLSKLHTWDPALMPTWEDADIVDIVTDYGATQHWVNKWDDDGPKIQQALNDAANPKHKHYGKALFIPFGGFHSASTIFLPSGSRIFGAGKQSRIEMLTRKGAWAVGQPLFLSEDADAPPGKKYGLVLVDFHLNTHARGTVFNLRTNKILWKQVVGSSDGLNQWIFKPLAPKTMLSGNAGGRIYGLTPGVLNLDKTKPSDWGATFTLFYVNGTSNPLHFYQMSIEHQACAHQTLVEDSANVHWHAFKYESVGIGVKGNSDSDKTDIIGGSLTTVRRSKDISMFGGSGNYALNHPDVSSSLLEFSDTSRIELWNMVRRPEGGHEMKGGNWVQDTRSDGSRDTLSDDHNILYYSDVKPTMSETKKPATTPATKKPATTPAKKKPATTPATKKPTTAAATKKPTTTPATKKPATTPATKKPATTPATKKPTTTPATKKPTKTPATKKPTTTPATKKPTPAAATKKPTPAAATKKSTPPPATKKPTTTPATKKPTTAAATKKPTPPPATKSPGSAKPVSGGLRLRDSKASIALGPDGDVKLFRSQSDTLDIEADVEVAGELRSHSMKVDGMDLKEYVRKLILKLSQDK